MLQVLKRAHGRHLLSQQGRGEKRAKSIIQIFWATYIIDTFLWIMKNNLYPFVFSHPPHWENVTPPPPFLTTPKPFDTFVYIEEFSTAYGICIRNNPLSERLTLDWLCFLFFFSPQEHTIHAKVKKHPL